MMGLFDLSKFEKIAQDKQTTTLKHKDGHQIRIVHGCLPRLQREQLKFLKLAEGGKVEGFEENEEYPEKATEKEHDEWMKRSDEKKKKNHHKFMQNHEEAMSGRKRMAKGGVAHYDQGTPNGEISQNDATPAQDVPDQGNAAIDPQSQADQSHTTNVYVNATPGQQPPPPALNPGQSLQQATAAPITQPHLPAQPNVLLPDKSLNAPGAAESGQQAIGLQQKIDTEKAKATANYEQQYVKERQRLTDIDAENFKELKGHTDDYRAYLQEHPINPNHFLEDRSTTKKISNAIGLFLGGLGGGLTGTGGNVALDFMNKQIDRDIAGQKERADQAKTLFGAYRELYHDSAVATNMAKVSMNDMLVHQTNLTASQLGTAQAKANALALGTQKAAENNKLLLDSAGRLGSTPNTGAVYGNGSSQPRMAGGIGTSGGAAPMSPQNEAQNGKPSGSWLDEMMMPGSQASIPPKDARAQQEAYAEQHILVPDHINHLKSLAYTPKAKEELPAIQSQYNQAIQAEKGLGQIHGTFSKLADSAQKSGELGNLRRNFGHELSKLPFGIGEVVGAPLRYGTDTQSNRLYDADKTALLGYISSALKGTNIGSGQIQEIVDVNSPENGDSKQDIARKENNIKDFITNHTDTGLLQKWGLSKK